MTTSNRFKALYQTLVAGPLTGITVQQPNLTKPDVATWAVVSTGGKSRASDADPTQAREYFRVWLYMDTDDELALIALADAVKAAIHNVPISGTDTGTTVLEWQMTSEPFWAEEYACRGIDLLFRTLTA